MSSPRVGAQASRMAIATAGQVASASLAAAAPVPVSAPVPGWPESRTKAMPSSPRSNRAGAIRWQYAEPTHLSGSTVIFTISPLTAEYHGAHRPAGPHPGSPVEGDREGLPSVQLHVLVASRVAREADGAVTGGQFREQGPGFHARQASPQAEVGAEAERRVTVALRPDRLEPVGAGEVPGVTVGGRVEHVHPLAGLDSRAGQQDVG